MNSVLVLIKSGQAKQYFQQNIAFLGQPEGAVVVTRYKRRWVCHGEGDDLPSAVLLLFSEPPYDHAVPVRAARLVSYQFDESDSDFQYTLELGPLFSLSGLDTVRHFVAHHRPGDHVVFTAPMALDLRADGTPQNRWNALVYHLVSDAYARDNNPYRHALFSYVHPARLPDSLVVGQSYHQVVTMLAPGLGADALRGVRVHSEAPVLDASIAIEGTAASGQLRVTARPLRALDHDWHVTLFFRPNEVASGSVPLHYPPTEALALPEAERSAYSRRQLYEWLSMRLSPSDRLKLLDRYLLPHDDGRAPDHHLLYARAALLRQEGQPGAAVDTLLQIPAEQRHDEMIALLVESAVAAQRRVPFRKLLEEVSNWEDGQVAGRLVRAIAQLPDEQEILELAGHLTRLAPNYAQRIWQTIGAAIRAPGARLALVEMLERGHANQPNGYLRLAPGEIVAYLSRESEPQRLPDTVLNRIVLAGMSEYPSGALAPFLMEWFERALRQGSAGETARARQWFVEARGWLSTSQLERATALLNDALKRVGNGEAALWLLLDEVTDAQREGDLERAERWLKVARDGISALPGDKRSEMLEYVKEEDGEIRAKRAAISASFAPRHGNDPGLTAIFELYQVEVTPSFWIDVADLIRSNPFVVQQLIERLEHLSKFAQESGTTYAKIHSLGELQGNVYRLELSDQARVIFKRIGRRIRLIALFASHDAYDEAIKNRIELMNRMRQ